MPEDVSVADARRIAVRAQWLDRPHPSGGVKPRHVRALVSALGAIQLDAVNVLVRSHYLAVYARLGPYPMKMFDDLVYQRRGAFEYWGHAASFLPIELQPLMRWRMDGFAGNKHWLAFQKRVESERPGYLAAVEREIAELGPLAFGELTDPARREKTPTKYAESSLLWYRWSDGKSALEGLFDAGRLAAAGRRGFERLYDLAERVIPASVLAVPTPSPDDATRALVLHAGRALGVATARDIGDYFRLPAAVTKARLRELVELGDLQPVRVEGWSEAAYLFPGISAKPVAGRALLSPFDSLLWERSRNERLFGFRHSFELYVKPANRRYGYFVLPFLLGDQLVARVDLKADRERKTLLVPGVFAESGRADIGELAAELRQMAAWLELDTVTVGERGDLAAKLRRAVG